MAMDKVLTKFEQGRIVEPQRHDLSQRAIANEIGRSRTAIANFIKNPDACVSKESSGRPNKISPSLNRCIRREVKRDSSLTSNQIKANPAAGSNSRTIRRHLNKKGFKNVKRLQRPRLLPRHKTSRLQFASDHQTWDVDKWKKVLFSDEKNSTLMDQTVFSVTGMRRISQKMSQKKCF